MSVKRRVSNMKKIIVLLLVLGLFGCINLNPEQKNQTAGNLTQNISENNSIVQNITENGTLPVEENQTIEPPASTCDETPYGVTFGEQKYNNRCEDSQLVRYYCFGGEVQVEKAKCKTGTYCVSNVCKETACYDSGSGSNRFQAGNVTYKNRVYQDTCSERFNVRKYSCRDDELISEVISCELGCTNGACMKKTYTCSDSDGSNELVTGYVTVSDGYNSENFTDVCSTSQIVKEYTCKDNQSEFSLVRCNDNYFCNEGRCIPEPLGPEETIVDSSEGIDCHESDSGKNYYLTGTVLKGALSFADKCLNTKVLVEYYCTSSDKVVRVVVGCPDRYICYLGYCRVENPEE
jgi:hypothetical protein